MSTRDKPRNDYKNPIELLLEYSLSSACFGTVGQELSEENKTEYARRSLEYSKAINILVGQEIKEFDAGEVEK